MGSREHSTRNTISTLWKSPSGEVDVHRRPRLRQSRRRPPSSSRASLRVASSRLSPHSTPPPGQIPDLLATPRALQQKHPLILDQDQCTRTRVCRWLDRARLPKPGSAGCAICIRDPFKSMLNAGSLVPGARVLALPVVVRDHPQRWARQGRTAAARALPATMPGQLRERAARQHAHRARLDAGRSGGRRAGRRRNRTCARPPACRRSRRRGRPGSQRPQCVQTSSSMTTMPSSARFVSAPDAHAATHGGSSQCQHVCRTWKSRGAG